MKSRHLILPLLLTLLLFVLPSAGRHPLAGLALTGYSIQSVRPSSFRSLAGSVTVKVKNTGKQRSLRNVSAVLYRGGQKVASGRCSDLVFPAGASETGVTGQVQLADGVSLLTAVQAALSFTPSEYTADVVCSIVDADGRAETFVRRGIPLGNYIK